ncbi:MAG: hypothetical protein JW966_03390 [Anaerolineae bacterium]|nr:hypothetical protein [Anaerolineae bacterium]
MFDGSRQITDKQIIKWAEIGTGALAALLIGVALAASMRLDITLSGSISSLLGATAVTAYTRRHHHNGFNGS